MKADFLIWRLCTSAVDIRTCAEIKKNEIFFSPYLTEEQTISNWELGETSPNPEQLILLSKTFNKSIDELVGNEIEPSRSSETGDSIKNIYIGLAVIGGSIAGVWSFAANRFRRDEIILLIVVGMLVGVCLGVVCHNILRYIDRTR